ncbi:hypothetical protein HK102_011121, partial [Quaeritorhiza haematococci]
MAAMAATAAASAAGGMGSVGGHPPVMSATSKSWPGTQTHVGHAQQSQNPQMQ